MGRGRGREMNVARVRQKVFFVCLSPDTDPMEMLMPSKGQRKYDELCEALANQVDKLVRGPSLRGDTAAVATVAALCLEEKTTGVLICKGSVAYIVNALAAKNEHGQAFSGCVQWLRLRGCLIAQWFEWPSVYFR